MTSTSSKDSSSDSRRIAGAPRPTAALPRVDLDGVRFLAVTERRCVESVLGDLAAGHGGWMVTMNLDVLYQYNDDPGIRSLCRGASVFVADGMPLIWAARLQGTPLPERVCGSNLIQSLSARAADCGWSIYLLGGDAGTAEGAAEALQRRYPCLRVAGTYCPPRGFERDDAEVGRIVDSVLATRPDIVYVALGFPKQERLIQRLRGALPRTWWIGVGVSFSFLSGGVRRAPVWLQNAGLEWFHRMLQEPRRLIPRYLLNDVPYALRLLSRTMIRGFRRERHGSAPD